MVINYITFYLRGSIALKKFQQLHSEKTCVTNTVIPAEITLKFNLNYQ